MWQNDLTVLGATRVAIGLSTIIRCTPGSYRYATSLKLLSGGSLEIISAATLTGPGWGGGYLVDSSEVVNFNGPTAFYLAATGATATVAILMGFTSGATLV